MNNLGRSLVCASTAVVYLLAAHTLLGQTSFPKQFVTPQLLHGQLGALVGVGDLNGDHRPDILYGFSEEIATGPGTFRPVQLSTEFGTKLLDVNGDGKLDAVQPSAAVENCGQYPDGTWYCSWDSDSEFMVSLGNGDGTFRSPTVLDLGAAGSGSAVVYMVDLNGDGKPDAIMSCTGDPNDSSSSATFVLMNDGKGNFQLRSTLPYQPAVASGDFNKDGKMDVVVGGNGTTIWFGRGDGTFTNGPAFSTFRADAGVAGDFNHDGYLDIAAADNTFTSHGGTYVLWGKAGGTFAAPVRISTLPAMQIDAADLNHDGYLDLVSLWTSFAVFTNLKNGTYSNPRLYASPNSIVADGFGMANFNNDGYLDLVSGDEVLYGSYGAEFLAPSISMESAYAGYVASADFNHDGIGDVAVANQNKTVTVFPGTGKGYFNPPKTYNIGVAYGNIGVGDVNGDGIADLVAIRSSLGSNFPYDTSVLMGNGDGTFRAAVSSKVFGTAAANTANHQVYVIDVNHDGKGDLVGDWGVALGHGDGTFAAPKPFPSTIPAPIVGIAVGDYNRDSNMDVVVGSQANATIYTLFGDGKGNFSIAHQEKLNYTHPHLNAVTTADMNEDGIPDLVYSYSASPSTGAYNGLVVETNNGSGLFGNPKGSRTNYSGPGFDTLLVADFNRDGHMDVFDLTVSSFAGPGQPLGASTFFLGHGDGSLSSPQYVAVDMRGGVVLDLNGDGALDVAGPALDGSGVEKVLNTGAH